MIADVNTLDSADIDVEVRDLVEERGITRLCHFTQSRNLAHIFGDQSGLQATNTLKKFRMPFNASDENRYDRHEDLICCSIEYPNVFYFTTARGREILFKDWAVLLIRPDYIWLESSRFCPCNAATGGGAYVCSGVEGFDSLYDVSPPGPNTVRRGSRHMHEVPTNIQAEVMVQGQISSSDITGIVFQSEKQALMELTRLQILKVELECPMYVCPEFYDKVAMTNAIKNSAKPEMKLFKS